MISRVGVLGGRPRRFSHRRLEADGNGAVRTAAPAGFIPAAATPLGPVLAAADGSMSDDDAPLPRGQAHTTAPPASHRPPATGAPSCSLPLTRLFSSVTFPLLRLCIPFKTAAAMEEVIEGGPWLFQGQPIVLQKWEPGMVLRKLQHTQVPVWIKLRHLPVELWTTEGLSTVASGIGKPLYPDAITRACTRLDFARVCIMLDISSKLPKHIVIMVPHDDGGETACKVDVEYEWLPPKCTACMSLGHSTKGCPTTKPRPPPVSVFVQKPNVSREPLTKTPQARMAPPVTDASSNANEDKGKAIVLYNAFEVLAEPESDIQKGPMSSPVVQPDD
ncbi:UNVERIFIED_CONTAM: hypothetical protein Sradi_7188200 [Sesamum radiatum]|uniref:DUF4283 domain-containing protein n=1 Tax=Sesamum radiatum TaxID=300843 RepID=A0AAW2IRM4_SESRA